MKVFTRIYFLFVLCFVAIQADAQSVGGTTSGATSYCSPSNSGFISLVGYTGSILNWEFSTDGGLTWTLSPNTLPAESYFNLSQTTCYRAIVQNGAFPPDTSTESCITIYAATVAGTISGGGTFCAASGSGALTLSGNTGNPLYWEFSTDNGVSWTNVPDTTTTLNYINITQNTIYQTVVQNGPICPVDTSNQVFFIIDSLSSAGTISGNDTVCYAANSGTISLSGITGTVTSWIYSTDSGATWTAIPNTTPSQLYTNLTQQVIYQAIVVNNTCPADTSLPVTIDVFAPFPVNAGNDTTISSGQSVNLNGTGTGNPLWSPSTGLSSNTFFSVVSLPANTIVYTLTVTDTNGCSNSDNVIITVISPQFSGMISNLFTPNSDGINDTWFIENIMNYPGNEVFVYNIHGNKVFEQKDYMNDWKGTYNGADLPDGTYYYILKLDNDQRPFKGSVDILRNK
jgi:gliding motility-associated-like protein